ncbi:MAG: DUF177 domain-containing protein [Alphaproteobacteria bacterium]
MTEVVPFSWIVPLTDLPPAGREISRTLNEAECALLAKHAGIEAVSALAAKGQVKPWANGIEVEVSFIADVVQACVVTLEPVPDHIKGAFARRYLPGLDEAESGAIDLSPDEQEPPEPLVGDAIDLGPTLAEELILALNPYPRAPGAAVQEQAHDTAGASPFAVLERLKPKS